MNSKKNKSNLGFFLFLNLTLRDLNMFYILILLERGISRAASNGIAFFSALFKFSYVLGREAFLFQWTQSFNMVQMFNLSSTCHMSGYRKVKKRKKKSYGQLTDDFCNFFLYIFLNLPNVFTWCQKDILWLNFNY
ncbi:hypothetical protein BpHYR1_004163 [Brachionus plicatilis]|uniref:Uncharacterized protein n=1 Tax=Brachionus plicatilis TaxID=10195 RepID=A0A3M7RNG2_BRAPC|nr:hypothetical protein BpHYR1_004163 [Brachionus plicatilis]